MRAMLCTGLLLAGLATGPTAQAGPVTPVGQPAVSALIHDPAVQQVYWVCRYGRCVWVHRAYCRRYTVRHCWRRWVGGPRWCRWNVVRRCW